MKKFLSIILSAIVIVSMVVSGQTTTFASDCANNGYNHSLEYINDYDGNHYVYCINCDYEDYESCSYVYANDDADYHIRYCEKCDSEEYFLHNFKQTSIVKASPSEKGAINYKCSQCSRTKTKSISKPKSVLLSKTEFVYDGNVKKPTVKVVDYNGNKIESSNYSVKYAEGRKNVGSYKITVTFKGSKYKGTLTRKFKIIPKKTSISSLSASKNTITVKWSKKTTQTTGYQIKYSKNSNMSNSNTVTISNNSTTSKTIKSLSYNTTYYFRVRTYKTVNGTKYYSKWSDRKSKKTSAKKSSTSSNSGNSSVAEDGCVYITATGECYHRINNCGRGTYYKTTKQQAKNSGLRPCSKCW